MKEEEAKDKWCPYIRFTSDPEREGAFDNRGIACMCIGSDCMMWIEHTATNMATHITVPSGGDCGLKNRSI